MKNQREQKYDLHSFLYPKPINGEQSLVWQRKRMCICEPCLSGSLEQYYFFYIGNTSFWTKRNLMILHVNTNNSAAIGAETTVVKGRTISWSEPTNVLKPSRCASMSCLEELILLLPEPLMAVLGRMSFETWFEVRYLILMFWNFENRFFFMIFSTIFSEFWVGDFPTFRFSIDGSVFVSALYLCPAFVQLYLCAPIEFSDKFGHLEHLPLEIDLLNRETN